MGVSAASLFFGLGNATFFEPDEPRFAEATRQMFLRGDFVTPYFNGVPRFEKPILFYWLQAVAFAAAGATELAARLPAALAGLGAVLVLYALGRRFTSARASFIAALVLATMFRFVTYSRQGLTDIPVLFFIVCALYGFVRASQSDRPGASAMLAWASVGLGVLTKGPVGVLSLLIWGSYAAVRRDWGLVSRVRPVAGALVAAAIALPWYLVMVWAHGRAFVDFAIGHEVVARALDTGFTPARGFFYYFKVWPGDAAPWSVVFVAALAWAAFRWRRLDDSTRRLIGFALSWFLSVFLAFSLSRSKLPHYVLPAYPAAALLIGVFIDRIAERAAERRWWQVPISIVAVAMLAVAVVTAMFVGAVLPDGTLADRFLLPGLLLTGAVAIGLAVWRRTALAATSLVAVTLAGAFGLIGAAIGPRVTELFKPMPQLAREVQRTATDESQLGVFGRYGASSLIYYSQRNIRWLDTEESVVSFLSSQAGALCVMPLTDFTRLAPKLKGSVRRIATAEEFTVRIERLMERHRAQGRVWVLVGNVPASATR